MCLIHLDRRQFQTSATLSPPSGRENLSIQPPRGRRQMKKIVVGAMLLALLGSPAIAQTTSTTPISPTTSSPLPPGLADLPETKWGASDLPPGLSNEQAKRGWDTPNQPGWSNQNSQGWQNSGGPS